MSLTGVTVTVCGLFQFVGVNVNVPAETVPSPVLPEATVTGTFMVGLVSRTTVNETPLPASLVVMAVLDTLIPALSLSALVTETLLMEIPL